MDAGAAVKGEACLSSDGYTSVSESEAERDAADQFEAAEAAALEKVRAHTVRAVLVSSRWLGHVPHGHGAAVRG
jgi:hypothetical protein